MHTCIIFSVLHPIQPVSRSLAAPSGCRWAHPWIYMGPLLHLVTCSLAVGLRLSGRHCHCCEPSVLPTVRSGTAISHHETHVKKKHNINAWFFYSSLTQRCHSLPSHSTWVAQVVQMHHQNNVACTMLLINIYGLEKIAKMLNCFTPSCTFPLPICLFLLKSPV